MTGFYKNDNGIVLYGPNFVINTKYELRAESKDRYVYPIDGWYWFDTEEEAYKFFGLEKPELQAFPMHELRDSDNHRIIDPNVY